MPKPVGSYRICLYMLDGDKVFGFDIYFPPLDLSSEPIGRVDVVESAGVVAVRGVFLEAEVYKKDVSRRLPLFELRLDRARGRATDIVNYRASSQFDYGKQDPLVS